MGYIAARASQAEPETMIRKSMVEAAGVELFHILLFLQLTDSKKETKYSKAYSAGVIVRVSYTEILPISQKCDLRRGIPALDLPVLQARHSFSKLARECNSSHHTSSRDREPSLHYPEVSAEGERSVERA